MADAVSISATPAGEKTAGPAAWPWLLIAAAGALWFIAVNQLRVEWSINPQYAYGWTTPFFTLYLFMERWKTRPPAASPRGGTVWHIAAVLVALSLLPFRLVQETAPDWRLVSWALAGSVVVLSLWAVWFSGGMPWLKHFIIPICFFLVAVPWPVPIEEAIVQRLMRFIAAVGVEALGWWGVPAVQHGNVIEISTGSVGVEEACSGVRSLQTTLMISLFLGELFRFTTWRRLCLLAAGLLIAFVCNVGRALALVWLYAKHGQQSFAQGHDIIGLSVLLVTLAGLGSIAWLLRRRPAASEADEPSHTSLSRARLLPKSILIGLLFWLGFVELATETWYRSHETSHAQIASWSVAFPAQRAQFREMQIPEIARTILRYDEGRSAAWMDADGSHWSMVFLRWHPGRASVQLARSHGPEICLPASGMTMRSDLGVSSLQVLGLDLPTHSYVFTMRGHPVHVFYCLWEDRPDDEGPASTRRRMTSTSRLQGVWTGRRNMGQQVLEVAVSGPEDDEEARAAAVRLLGETIQVTHRPAEK